MDQIKIGNFIAQKRKEQNMTQEDLANALAISNKSVSKWECGKCMPDISLQLPLCEILHISLTELLAGEMSSPEVTMTQLSDRNLQQLLKAYEALKTQKDIVIGLVMIVVGKFLPLDNLQSSTVDIMQFIYGISMGMSIALIMFGVCFLVIGLFKTYGVKENKNS